MRSWRRWQTGERGSACRGPLNFADSRVELARCRRGPCYPSRKRTGPRRLDAALEAPRLGLEPRTYRLTAGRSTIELSGNRNIKPLGARGRFVARKHTEHPGHGPPGAKRLAPPARGSSIGHTVPLLQPYTPLPFRLDRPLASRLNALCQPPAHRNIAHAPATDRDRRRSMP